MLISILTPDLSHNCLGRAYLLAKILQRRYETEIVGPMFDNKIWEPLSFDNEITYKAIRIKGKFRPYLQIHKLIKKIDGNIIYVSKPLFANFGISLVKKLNNKIPLILDIDDWQVGLIKDYLRKLSFINKFKYLVSSILYFYNINSFWNSLIFEKLIPFANEITVSNNFLKSKFGGTIIWHGRDTDAFDPKKFDEIKIREKYQIDNSKKIIMFFGTIRPYKGVDDLIKAISLIDNKNIILILVGVDKNDYSLKLVGLGKKLLGNRLITFGLQPFEKVPEFLSMADIVVIPQKYSLATIGQIPAKVFDAMALAKPIIATNVSDLPLILNDCGLIVEPNNPFQLSNAIKYILNNPDKAKIMGHKARKICIKKYSWNSLEKTLLSIFKKYE